MMVVTMAFVLVSQIRFHYFKLHLLSLLEPFLSVVVLVHILELSVMLLCNARLSVLDRNNEIKEIKNALL